MTATFPNPRLDTDDGNQATADLHAREDLLLDHYSSVAGDSSTIRIPISRAMELIACVVTSEVFDILKNNEVYNEIRYAAGLLALPQPPWEGEEDVE